MDQRKINTILSAIAFLCCLHTTLFGQTISASPNRTRIFIGEQVMLRLAVENAHQGISWFQFADTLNHLEVVQRSKIDTVLSGGVTNFYQTIAITSFDSGKWQFPALAIASINQITMPITIDVIPVDVSQKKDYNEIKEIEEVQLFTHPFIIGILVIITLFSLCMIYILIQKKKIAALETPVLQVKGSAWNWAEKELSKLQQPSPSAHVEIKNYYSKLNYISRTFFSLQLNEDNKQYTTDEWMVKLNKLSIELDSKIAFFQFLRLSDSVRFAKFSPPAPINSSAVETIKSTLYKASLIQHIHLPLNQFQQS